MEKARTARLSSPTPIAAANPPPPPPPPPKSEKPPPDPPPSTASSVLLPSSFHTRNAFAPATPRNGATPLALFSRRFSDASASKYFLPGPVSFRSFRITALPFHVPSKTSPNDPLPIFLPFDTSAMGMSTLTASPSVSACSYADTRNPRARGPPRVRAAQTARRPARDERREDSARGDAGAADARVTAETCTIAIRGADALGSRRAVRGGERVLSGMTRRFIYSARRRGSIGEPCNTSKCHLAIFYLQAGRLDEPLLIEPTCRPSASSQRPAPPRCPRCPSRSRA